MLLWLIVAAVAAVGELLTTGFFLMTVAVAAVITAIAAPFVPETIQVSIFAVLALGGIALVRPLVMHSLGLGTSTLHSGGATHAYVEGKHAVVTRQVNADGGQVRIGQAEFWSARPVDTTLTIAVGTRVEIVQVDGVTALVSPLAGLPSREPELITSVTKGEAQ